MPDDLTADSDGYDVIGDVHGSSDKLRALLEKLGYSDESGAYRHRSRQAIFVGDLIDRGPGQLEVLRTVRAMVDAGAAIVVMGNHEFNAIAYATPDPQGSAEFLRPHTAKNRKQHKAFLEPVGEGSVDHAEVVDWFKTFPLWLDLGQLRVVHACWAPTAMKGLGAAHVNDEMMVNASNRKHAAYKWVEHLCKGPEIRLPDNRSFIDKDGHERHHARLRWWDPQADTYLRACELPPGNKPLPDTPLTKSPVAPYRDDVPVIFGHYWRDWAKVELTATTACVDYSAAVDGEPLVAYRWSGETTLRRDHLVASHP